MELYYTIAIIDRDRLHELTELLHAIQIPMVLINLGRGTALGEHLTLYNLESTPKAIVSAIADSASLHRLMHSAEQKLYMDIPGNGVLAAIPIKSVGGGKTLAYITEGQNPKPQAPKMDFEHELIVVILNEGNSDLVMDAARSAGATGGTVFHAKGTGTAKPEKFFGISLVDERDVIYIIANRKNKAEIMRAISEKAGMNTPARAFCFSLPVSEVVGLRKLDEETDG